MATLTDADDRTEAADALVDPRAPRFGQSVTAVVLAAGIALAEPVLVVAVAVVLNLAVVSSWRADLYAVLWRHAMVPLVGPPAEREPAAPHRFAKLMGAVITLVASALLLADLAVADPAVADPVLPALATGGLAVAGYAVAGLVALLAGIAAVFDVCVGCRMYQQVSFFRRLGVV